MNKAIINGSLDDLSNNILLNHDIKVEIIIAEGIVGQTVVKAVVENDIDLVVMGSHGISGARYQYDKIQVAVSVCKNRNIAEGVLAKAKQLQADLVIISAGIDMPDRPLFIGPFSQRIINHSKVPILSLLRMT